MFADSSTNPPARARPALPNTTRHLASDCKLVPLKFVLTCTILMTS